MSAADVPDHLAEAVATVRAFQSASGAERVVLLIDRGTDRAATMVEGDPTGVVRVVEDAEPLRVEAQTPPGSAPRALPELRPAPATAIVIDPESGELEAPLGAIANLARGVLALATAFGGRSVASADFATRDPEVPLTIAAREGDPFVIAAGDRRFELPVEALG
jgi:hypothetical protein